MELPQQATLVFALFIGFGEFFAHYFTELITWKKFKEYLINFMTSCIRL